ncbi:MAG: FAD-dependent oxidoreductase [Leptospiraceae bacterium]|nr:FAD-dependent oxidoreductase [Leptospiraceae bacterium]MCP5498935.1 FAD-dependent oxidoreductase [Leptospiraceae bacterium]
MTGTKKQIVIVGGVAGGATAAARARRVDENAEITIIERGKYVSFANCGLPYYISGDIKQREDLILQSPESFYERYRIRVLLESSAVMIDRKERILKVSREGKIEDFPYDKLILSQGASPLNPNIEGLPAKNTFTLREIPDMDTIDTFIKQSHPKNAVVIGGGFIGIEMAEALHNRGLEVKLVEKAHHVMPNFDIEFGEAIRREMEAEGVQVFPRDGVKKIDPKAKEVYLESGHTLSADMVIVSIGVRPELELAKSAGLSIGKTGGVLVNNLMQSSDPDIYVVGDMAEISHRIMGRKVRIPLAGPANRQGRIAGSNAAGDTKVYHGANGSAIVKIFTKAAGITGFTEKAAKEAGLDIGTVTVHPKNHAGYYPGSSQISLKLVYLKGNGRVLGVQVFGEEGVDKRVDVIATAIHGGLTVEDLEELDLSYAPPFSSANDPVNMASFVASNSLNGFSPSISVNEFIEKWNTEKDFLILDVRNPEEYERGHIPGAINIPLPDLRERISELPIEKEILVHCQVGFRAHLAVRILMQKGFHRVSNISGGYKSMELLEI